MDRRALLKTLSAIGVGTPIFHRAVAVLFDEKKSLSVASLQQAAWITDFNLSDEQAKQILARVKRNELALNSLRQIPLDHQLNPAIHFKTLATNEGASQSVCDLTQDDFALPKSDEEIAFLPIHKLASLIRSRQLASEKLTEIYLERLKKFGPMLRCVVNLTEDLAIEQAKKADREIADGKYRGALHGIPWGAKDLIAVPDYPTTWGIPVFKDRVIDQAATVYSKLTDAGAVLVAKLSLGAIAMGDKWFGGQTRNPWDPASGSSGSSAGSCSATVAGLVGFSLGSETLGSITTPSRVCGSYGFRPTFGRVSRHGCMPLSWTMDKVGPICRSVEDCAIVFSAIHGADEKDTTTYSAPFHFAPKQIDMRDIRVGYSPGKPIEDRPVLNALQTMGCQLNEASPPTTFPIYSLANIIDIEAASVFDHLLRAGETEGWNTWPVAFRSSQFVSAIDYLRMMRLRTRLMNEFESFIQGFDVLVDVYDVFHTNLTGHPSIVVPTRIRQLENQKKQPVTTTITGHLNKDDQLLSVAHSIQQQIGLKGEFPDLDFWLQYFADSNRANFVGETAK